MATTHMGPSSSQAVPSTSDSSYRLQMEHKELHQTSRSRRTQQAMSRATHLSALTLVTLLIVPAAAFVTTPDNFTTTGPMTTPTVPTTPMVSTTPVGSNESTTFTPAAPRNLSIAGYGDRSVRLSWLSANHGAMPFTAESLVLYRVHLVNGTDSSFRDFSTAQIQISSSTIQAEISDLVAGVYYDFSVSEVHNLSGTFVEGSPTGQKRTLILSRPSAPQNLQVRALRGGLQLNWDAPLETGVGARWMQLNYSSADAVLVAYKVKVAAAGYSANPFDCVGGQSELCKTLEVSSHTTTASLTGLQGGQVFSVWVLGYNVELQGLNASTSFLVRDLPSSPQNLTVEVTDHLVLSLDWNAPAFSGAAVGSTFDYYKLEWTNQDGDFTPCQQQPGPVQCYSTSYIPLPSGCRSCAVVTCQAGEVCVSSEVLSSNGATLIALGCASQATAMYYNDGTCSGPLSSNAHSNCHACNTSLCNNAVPSVSQSAFCPFDSVTEYCSTVLDDTVTVGGSGLDFAAVVVSESICDRSETVMEANLSAISTNFSIGSSFFSQGVDPTALTEGSSYFFRLAGCWFDLGCGTFSSPVGTQAVRIPMRASYSLGTPTAGQASNVSINFTTIKEMPGTSWLVEVEIPHPFRLLAFVNITDEGTLCRGPKPIGSMISDSNITNSTNSSLQLNSTTEDYSGCASAYIGGASTVRIEVNNSYLPAGSLVTFTLSNVVVPPFSGMSPTVRISTFATSVVGKVDENPSVSGVVVGPGKLSGSVAALDSRAGEFTRLDFTIESVAGNPIPADGAIFLHIPAGFIIMDAVCEIPGGCEVYEAMNSIIKVRLTQPVIAFPFTVGIGNVRIAQFPGESGSFQIQTALSHNVSTSLIDTSDAVAGFNITVGDLDLGVVHPPLRFGGVGQLRFDYMHSRLLINDTAILRITFPVEMNLSFAMVSKSAPGYEAFIGSNDSLTNLTVTHRIVQGYDMNMSSGATLELTFPPLPWSFHWDINVTNVELPYYGLIKTGSFDAQVFVSGQVINETSIPFAYSPGLLINPSIALLSTVAGEETSANVSFTMRNPAPDTILVDLYLPDYFQFGMYVNHTLHYNGMHLNSTTLEVLTTTLVRVRIEGLQDTTPNAEVSMSLGGIVVRPWSGQASFALQVRNESLEVIELANDVSAGTTVEPAVMLAASVELAEKSKDRFGRWDTTRPVASETTDVHLGIMVDLKNSLPRSSSIVIDFPDVMIDDLQLDSENPHMVGSSMFDFNFTTHAITITQADSSCDLLACVASSLRLHFNFLANVRVAAGFAAGRSRGYTVTAWQSVVGYSVIETLGITSKDALIPGLPDGFNARRRLLASYGISGASMHIGSSLSNDLSNIIFSFTLLTSFPANGIFVLNFPSDTVLMQNQSIDATGLDGGFAIDVSNSSIALQAQSSSDLIFGDTEKICRTTGGSAPSGTLCHLPFVYLGVTYQDCTSVDNAGVPWCSTTPNFKGMWGNCNCTRIRKELDITLTVKGVRNQPYAGVGNFQILALSSNVSSDSMLAQEVGLSQTFVVNTLSNLAVNFADPKSGSMTSVLLSFAPASPIPADGMVQLQFPVDIYQVNGSNLAWGTSGYNTNWNSSFEWPILNLTRQSAEEIPALTAVAIEIPRVQLRYWSGAVGFTVRTFMGPSVAGAPSDVGAVDVTIVPNNHTETEVILSPRIAGHKGIASLRFRPTNAVPTGGGIHVTVPQLFKVEDPSLSPSWKLCGVVGRANFTVERISIDADQRVLLLQFEEDQMLPGGGMVEFTIPGITSRPFSGTTDPFIIRTITSEGAVIDHVLSGTEQELLPNMLSAQGMRILSSEAGALSTAEVSFTTSNLIPGDGKIIVSFPSGFSLLSPVSDGYLRGIPGMIAVVDAVPINASGYCAPGCNVTLLIRGNDTPAKSKVSLGIANVENMHRAGSTGTYFVQTLTASNLVIDEASIDPSTVGPSKLGFAEVVPASESLAGSRSSYNVSFTTENPIASGGQIIVVFPPVFTLNDTCYINASGLTGVCGSISISGDGFDSSIVVSKAQIVVTATVDIAAEMDVSFRFDGIRAPTVAGFTGTYQIKTLSGGKEIDVDLEVPSTTTTPGIQEVVLTPQTPLSGFWSTISLLVRISNTLPASSSGWLIEFPAEFSFSSMPGVEVDSDFDGTLMVSLTGHVIALLRQNGASEIQGGSYVRFNITGLKNPGKSGRFPVGVQTFVDVPSLASNSFSPVFTRRIIDSNKEGAIDIQPAPLQQMQSIPPSLHVGYRGPLRLRFRTYNELPANGRIRITFPASVFDVATVVSSTFFAALSPAAQVVFVEGSTCTSLSGTSVLLTRTGGSLISGSVIVELEVANLYVHGHVGSMGNIEIQTMDSQETVIDQGMISFSVLEGGMLTELQVEAGSTIAGDSGEGIALQISFWSANLVHVGGSINITMPAGTVLDIPNVQCSAFAQGSNARFLGDMSGVLEATNTTPSTQGDTIYVILQDAIRSDDAINISCSGAGVRQWEGAAVYLVRTVSPNGLVVDSGSGTHSADPASIGSTLSISPVGGFAGQVYDMTIQFETVNPIPAQGRIEIEPDRFVVSQGEVTSLTAALKNGSTFLPATNKSFESEARSSVFIVDVLESIAAGSRVELHVGGFTAREFAGAAPVSVRTRHDPAKYWETANDRQNLVIDQGTFSVNLDPFGQAGNNTRVDPETAAVGSRLDITFRYELANGLPGDGAVYIKFPSEYDLSTVSAESSFLQSIDGEALVEVDTVNNTVILARESEQTASSGTLLIVHIMNVGLPGFETADGSFEVSTTTKHPRVSGSSQIEVSDPFAPILVVRSALGVPSKDWIGEARNSLPFGPGNISVSPDRVSAGSNAIIQLNFWTVNVVPGNNNGFLKLTLPSGNTWENNADCNGSLPAFNVVRDSSSVVRLLLTADSLRDSTAVHLECGPIKVQGQSGIAGAGSSDEYLRVQTMMNSDKVIDEGQVQLHIESGSLPGTVTFSSLIAGQMTNATLSLTFTNALPANGFVEIDFPAGFRVDDSVSSTNGLSRFQVQTLNYDTSIPQHPQPIHRLVLQTSVMRHAGSALIFDILNFRNRDWSGDSGVFLVRTKTASGVLIDGCDPEVQLSRSCSMENLESVILHPAEPSSPEVRLEMDTAGSKGRVALSFTTVVELYNNSRIVLQFPDTFNVDPHAPLSGNRDGIDGELLPDVVDDTVSLERNLGTDIPVGTTVRIEFAGIRNRKYSSCTAYDFELSEQSCDASSGNALLRILTSNGGVTDEVPIAVEPLIPAPLNNSNVEPQHLVAGALGSVSVHFRTVNPLPSNGKIAIRFPAGITFVRPLLAQAVAGIDGLLTVVAVSGTEVVIERLRANTVASGTLLEFNITGVRNRMYSGWSGTYQIRTKLFNDTLIDVALSVPSDYLVPGDLQDASALPTSEVAGNTTMSTFEFVVANPLPADGGINIMLPDGFRFPTEIVTTDGSNLGIPVQVQVSPVEQSATFVNGINEQFNISLVSSREIILWRTNASSSIMPCKYSRPEIELNREIISPGFDPHMDDSSLYTSCKITLHFPRVVNRHMPRIQNVYRFQTLMPDMTIIDEATVDGHKVVSGMLLRTDVQPSSLVAGSATDASVSLIAANGLPKNGMVEVTFPEHFLVSGVTLGLPTTQNFKADGSVLVANTHASFTVLEASSGSTVLGDLSRITVMFQMNAALMMPPEIGATVIFGNLSSSPQPSGFISIGGPDASKFEAMAFWSMEEGTVTMNVSQHIPAYSTLEVWFDLKNPNELTAGVSPTITTTTSCGYECFSMPITTSVMQGTVLKVESSKRFELKTIRSNNRIKGEVNAIDASLKLNFALEQGAFIIIGGLSGFSTESTLNLTVYGDAASWFRYQGNWSQEDETVSLALWRESPVSAGTNIDFSFRLRNNADNATVANPTIAIKQISVLLSMPVEPMNGTLMVSTVNPSFLSASLTQNTYALNALNLLTLSFRPSVVLEHGVVITLGGLTQTDTTETQLALLGDHSSRFVDQQASWSASGGVLQLTVSTSTIPDNQDTVVAFNLRNKATVNEGSIVNITTSKAHFESTIAGYDIMNANETGAFTVAKLTYSTSLAYARNLVTVTLVPNTNLGPGATIRIHQLPVQPYQSGDSGCSDTTIGGSACVLPFEWNGNNYSACTAVTAVGVQNLQFGDARSAWCAISTDLWDMAENQTSRSEFMQDQRGIRWDFCQCTSNTKEILPLDSTLFGRHALFSPNSTLTLFVAPGQEIKANQEVSFSFVITNPGVMDSSGLPDYLVARIKYGTVNPYVHVQCQEVSLDIPLNETDVTLQERIALAIGLEERDSQYIVVNNNTQTGQSTFFVEFCLIDPTTVDITNSYGFLPQIEASDGPLKISATRVEAAELIIKPNCSVPTEVSSGYSYSVDGVVRVNSDPTFLLFTISEGSAVYGALTSVTVSFQPNWELGPPTKLSICCFANLTSPTMDDNIAVFNEGGIIFGFSGKYNSTSGQLQLRVAQGQVVPCDRPTTISVALRNFRTRYQSPTAITLSADPANMVSFSTVTQISAENSVSQPSPSAFWETKSISDTTRAFGTTNRVTVTLRLRELELFAGSNITIGGLKGSQDMSATEFPLEGAAASTFSATFINERDSCSDSRSLDCEDPDARLVLSVKPNYAVYKQTDTVISFTLTNKAYYTTPVVPTITVRRNDNESLSDPIVYAESMDGSILGATETPGFQVFDIETDNDIFGALSTISIKFQANVPLSSGTYLNLTGLVDSCPDHASTDIAPPTCENAVNPSDPMLPLGGQSASLFGGQANWNGNAGVLALRLQQDIEANDRINISFALRNKGTIYGGVSVTMKVQNLASQLEDGMLINSEGSVVSVQRDGSGREILPGETISFTLDKIVVRGYSGPSGTYILKTRAPDGTVIDVDDQVESDTIIPSILEAKIDYTNKIIGFRGNVTVSFKTSNPLPTGGTIHVWFPDGFLLDTGHWDVPLWDDEYYFPEGQHGLIVTSDDMEATVKIGTEGSILKDEGLDKHYRWNTSAIVTNHGTELPAFTLHKFTLHNVQYPLASLALGTYQIRTFTPDGASIDEDLHVDGTLELGAGVLLDADVQPSSLRAGAVSNVTVSFTLGNPLPPDGRIEVLLPEGFAISSEVGLAEGTTLEPEGAQRLDGLQDTMRPNNPYDLDFAVGTNPGLFVPVGSKRARMIAVSIDEGLTGELLPEVLSARRIRLWRRGTSDQDGTAQRRTNVKFTLYDPTAEFDVTAPILGVQNPAVSGVTGPYQVQTFRHDGSLIDQDLTVDGDTISPGHLEKAQIVPETMVAGATSTYLNISFAVANTLPERGRVMVQLPDSDIYVVNTSMHFTASSLLDSVDGNFNIEVGGTQSFTIIREGGDKKVPPCQRPICGAENVVSGGNTSSSKSQSPYHPDGAFVPGSEWRSGPVMPSGGHWIQYDFGKTKSICSYSFMSRSSDVLGYVAKDGPTSYELRGSPDGNEPFHLIHQVTNGSVWSNVDEKRVHELTYSAHFRVYRLYITGVPGRDSGSKYTVIRNFMMTSPTGADPHTKDKETQCLVSLQINGLFRNRHWSGMTREYQIKTMNENSTLVDLDLQAAPSLLRVAPIEVSRQHSVLNAGRLAVVVFNFTTFNPIPKDGEIEVMFPEGILLDQVRETDLMVSGVDGGIRMHIVNTMARLIRNDNGTDAPAGTRISIALSNVRNPPVPVLGGTYQIRTRMGVGLGIDEATEVPGVQFTIPSFINASLDLPSMIAGAVGSMHLRFTNVNPIGKDGRFWIQLPLKYTLLEPLHAVWLQGASGLLLATLEANNTMYLLRESEEEIPAFTELVIQVSTIINVPREGSSGTFRMCSMTHDYIRIDCVAPDCAGCSMQTSAISPESLDPADLLMASVRPGEPTTGHNGLEVSFITVNSLQEDSEVWIDLPADFQVQAPEVVDMKVNRSTCPDRDDPEDNLALPLQPSHLHQPSTFPTVTPTMTHNGVHRLIISGSEIAVDRGASISLHLLGVKAPRFETDSGTFQLRTKSVNELFGNLSLVDIDYEVPSVLIERGMVVNATTMITSMIAGSHVNLTVDFYIRNEIPSGGVIDVDLPPTFDPYWLHGMVRVYSAGSVDYEPVTINGTTLTVSVSTARAGGMSLMFQNVRIQNHTGPTGTYQIKTKMSQYGSVLDEDLQVSGQLLRTAPLFNAAVTVTDPTAGTRSRLLVEFVASNPLPVNCTIAVALPAGFQVGPNSSVAIPVGNDKMNSNSSLLLSEYDAEKELDGNLIVRAHGDRLVTIHRDGSGSKVLQLRRIALFIDQVRNPQFSQTTGTFQVRTLLPSGVPIDEDLAVPAIAINPGNFTGVCPPFCVTPQVLPSELFAGSVVSVAVAFVVSNPWPADGELEVQMFPDSNVAGLTSVTPGSVLDSQYADPGRPGPTLDGLLQTKVLGQTVRVRRDGSGREIKVGEYVSLTFAGLVNQPFEGPTQIAKIQTELSDGTVIDRTDVQGHVLAPVGFNSLSITKDPSNAGQFATLVLTFSTNGAILPDSQIEIDFSRENRERPELDEDLQVLGEVVSSTGNWTKETVESGRKSLLLKYQGNTDIPPNTLIDLTVFQVKNPAYAQTVEYTVKLLTPSSGDSEDVKSSHSDTTSFTYDVGGLQDVEFVPALRVASAEGLFSVKFTTLNPIPADGLVEIQIPAGFVFLPPRAATILSGMNGTLTFRDHEFVDGTFQDLNSRIVTLERDGASGVVAAGVSVEISIDQVRVQSFAGESGLGFVTTRLADGTVIDSSETPPVLVSTTSLTASTVSLGSTVAGDVTELEVRFVPQSPLPPNGQLLLQLPAGIEVLSAPSFTSLMGTPVRFNLIPSTFLYGLSPSPPYYSFTDVRVNLTTPSPNPSEYRGASILLQGLGDEELPANQEVRFTVPSIRLRPFSGASGTFQVATLLGGSSNILLDQDQQVAGPEVVTGLFTDVTIDVSSIFPNENVTVYFNFTLKNQLPTVAEIHITFPAGYREIEYARVIRKVGIPGSLTVMSLGAASVLRMQYQSSSETPSGTPVQIVLTGIKNRFFSSRSQDFRIETFLQGGSIGIDSSGPIEVPGSGATGRQGYGVVVDREVVQIFDAADPSRAFEAASIADDGSVTHGVSALDLEGDRLFFVAGGKLMQLDLESPEIKQVLLYASAEVMGGFVSIEWDSVAQRLIGLALLDGEMIMSQIDQNLGNVSALSPQAVLPGCGSCECSPSQGVSAIDTENGLFYMSSQLTLLTMRTGDGSLERSTPIVQGDGLFTGFASLEFDGLGLPGDHEPLGLLGIAMLGDQVELVQVDPMSGSLTRFAQIFDEEFSGNIVGGVSSLTPGNRHYVALAHSKLLYIDLSTRVVSYFTPYSGDENSLGGGSWSFVEMARFMPSRSDDLVVDTATDAISYSSVPLNVDDMQISVLELEASLPVRPGDENNYFSVRVTGSDVRVNDSIAISASSECSDFVTGGGPLRIETNQDDVVSFSLGFDEPAQFFFCYSRNDGFNNAFRRLNWGASRNNAVFQATVASFAVNNDTLPVGSPVAIQFAGALQAGDVVKLVLDDDTINPADLCTLAPLYPGSQPITLVAIDALQVRMYDYGAVTEISADVLLTPANGAALRMCYRPAGTSQFTLMYSHGDTVDGSVVSVLGVGQGATSQCEVTGG